MTSHAKIYEKLPKPTFVRQRLGTAKIAPVDMRKDEHQFVIDGYLIEEVLNQIPEGIHILQAQVWLIKRGSDQQITIPIKLRKLGVTTIRQTEPVKRITLRFDACKKGEIRKSVGDVCRELEIPFGKSYFGYIVLSNGEGAGKFKHCTKEIHPDVTDKRKKLRVLGLVSGQGKVQSLVADLGAKKFKCSIKEEAVKLVMCSRE